MEYVLNEHEYQLYKQSGERIKELENKVASKQTLIMCYYDRYNNLRNEHVFAGYDVDNELVKLTQKQSDKIYELEKKIKTLKNRNIFQRIFKIGE